MSRELPLVGVTISPDVQPNSVWYQRLFTKFTNAVAVAVTSAYNANVSPASNFVSIGQRTYSFKTRRGRTYELGRIESGEAQLEVDNSDGFFDPVNGNANIFRPVTITAAYPSTGNILNDSNLAKASFADAPTSTDTSRISVGQNDADFELGALSNWYAPYASGSANGPTVQSFVAPYAGTYCMALDGSSTAGVGALDIPVIPNKPITVSFYAKAGNASNSMYLYVHDGGWKGSVTPVLAGFQTSWSNISTSFARYSFTCTPTGSKITLQLQSQSTTIYVDNVQVEFASTASTFTTSGPTVRTLFNGFVERYPQTFQAPNRGQANLVATDAIASLSQVKMSNLYEQIVLGDDAPNLYYYPLSENAGSVVARNASPFAQSFMQPVSFNTGGFGFVAPTFGVTSAQTGVLGSATTGVDFSCQAAPTPFQVQGGTLQNTNVTDIVFDVGNSYTFSFWVRPQYIAASGLQDVLFGVNAVTGVPTVNMPFIIGIGNDGAFRVLTSGGTTPITTSAVTAGTWNFISLNVTRTNSTTYTFSCSLNGATATTGTWSNSDRIVVNNFVLSGPCAFTTTYTPASTTTIAHLSIHRGSITPSLYYASGKYAQATSSSAYEQTGTRFGNILSKFSGFKYLPYSTNLGKSQMQPLNTTDTSVVDYIQNIADTENGTWFVDGSGYVTFQDRWQREQKLVPSVIFGDGTGEIPYEGGDVVIDFDPTYIYNDVTIVRNGGLTITTQDTTSLADYYPRSISKTIYNGADTEASDAAYYLLSRYKDPHARPVSITLTPARNPSVFNSALGLEVGDYVRVNKRPLGATAISVDCFVERVEHEFNAQTADWITQVFLSPQIVSYWNLAALRATSNGGGAVNLPRVTKSANRSTGGIFELNDVALGTSLLVQYTNTASPPLTYVGVTRPSLCTDGSGYVNLSVQLVKAISSSTNLSDVTGVLGQSLSPDYTGSITLSSPLSSNGNSTIWMNGELMDATGTGSTLTITNRGRYGTTPRTHFSGETIYATSANSFPNPANGLVLSEFLGGSNVNANQLTRLPYVMGAYNAYDAASVLGSWNNTLYTNSFSTYSPPNTSVPSLLQYVFTLSPLVSKQSYPVNDLEIGQLLSIRQTGGSTLDTFAVAYASSLDSTTGAFNVNLYQLDNVSSALSLSTSMSIDATTITATTAFPNPCYAVWVDGEFMSVVSGAGTTTLTVVRGTPDAGAYPRLQASSRHTAGARIYAMPNAAGVGTFPIGAPVVEGATDTIITGTTRLGY